MAAYNQLPWLNVQPGDFLHAIMAGANDRMQRQSLQLSAQRGARSPGFISGAPAVDPREQAMADKLNQETKLKADETAGANQAWDQYQSLTARGATPQEAYEQSGLGRYDVKGSAAGITPDKTFEIGDQVVKVDPETGATKVLYSGPGKPAPLARRYAGPMGINLMGNPTGSMSLTLPEWAQIGDTLPDKVRTNSPVSSYIQWGKTNGFPAPAISAPVTATKSSTAAPFQVPMGPYGNMDAGSAADYLTPAKEPGGQAQEVIRRTKDGRRAVYDAITKQFIRYAE